ncbi:MAG: RNA methyltransferase [bacterium]|nr:RNA methyltransferase [bacterium]
MKISEIMDLKDPRVADYRGVRDPEWVRERGLFIAEGLKVVEILLLESDLGVRSLLTTENAFRRLEPVLGGARADLEVFLADGVALRSIAGHEIHQNCLAIGERPDDTPIEGLLKKIGDGARRLLVLDRVTNPDNIGGLFRNARAFGVDAVLLGPGCAHPLYRKAIRTSMGSSLLVPFTGFNDWRDTIAELRKAGFACLALTPAQGSDDLAGLERGSVPSRYALLLGHEGEGLHPQALELADRSLRIAISEAVESLNVATAAAVALHALGSPAAASE